MGKHGLGRVYRKQRRKKKEETKFYYPRVNNREFTKPRRGRRGQRPLKNHESRNTLKSFALFITVKPIAKLTAERNDKFEIKN